MFGFKSNKEPDLPIKEETRLWLDKAFLWLVGTFGESQIKNRKVLTPAYSDFPIKYNGKPEAAFNTLKIVADQMELYINAIHLDIYEEGQREIDTGGSFGNRIFMKEVEGDKYSGGLYWGKQDDGKYHIGLEKKKLTEPLDTVATLAHEISHIKLLGENRIEKNNEPLTDLTTIIFGLGIFNANSAFQTKNGPGYWGWSKLGYLSQMEWGYALALFAFFRNEESPGWLKFLATNIKGDFKRSFQFINQNKHKIFSNSSDA